MDDLRKALTELRKCSSGMKKKRKNDEEKTAKAELVVTLSKGGKFKARSRNPSMSKMVGDLLRDEKAHPNAKRNQSTVPPGKPKITPGNQFLSHAAKKKSLDGIPDLSKSFSTDVIPLHIRNATESSPINALRRK